MLWLIYLLIAPAIPLSLAPCCVDMAVPMYYKQTGVSFSGPIDAYDTRHQLRLRLGLLGSSSHVCAVRGSCKSRPRPLQTSAIASISILSCTTLAHAKLIQLCKLKCSYGTIYTFCVFFLIRLKAVSVARGARFSAHRSQSRSLSGKTKKKA